MKRESVTECRNVDKNEKDPGRAMKKRDNPEFWGNGPFEKWWEGEEARTPESGRVADRHTTHIH